MREDLQDCREEIRNMQEEIDILVAERDEAMDKANYFETEMEHWRNAARYWQARCEEGEK